MLFSRITGLEPAAGVARDGERGLSILDALDAAPFGVAVLDRDLRFVHANAALAAVDGVPAEAHAGRTLRELFPAFDGAMASVEARVRAVLETGVPAVFDAALSAPGEERREWRAAWFPVRGADGTIQAACGVVTDVTSERQREAGVARARGEAERTARRLGYLRDVTAALSAATDPSGVAEVVVERARALVGASAARLRLLHGDTLDLLAASSEVEVSASARCLATGPHSPCGIAAASRQPLWLSDPEAIASRFAPEYTYGAAAVAVLPLSARGTLLGTLALQFDRPQEFDLEARAFLVAVAEHCAQALDRALGRAAERAARAESQRLAWSLARLQGITASLSAARTTQDVGAVLVRASRDVLGAETAVAYVVDPGGNALSLAGAIGRADANRERLGRLPLDAPTPAALAARTGEPCWLESRAELAAAVPRIAEVLPYADAIGAMAALPLRARGEVLGAVGFAYERERRFEPEERELLSAVAEQCAQALDRARLLDREREARAEAQRLARRLACLQEITAALSAARTPEEIARVVAEQAHAVVGAAVSAVFALEPHGDLRLLGTRGLAAGIASGFERIPPTAPLPACRVVATGQPVWLETLEDVHAEFPSVAALPNPRERSAVVALPLRAGGRAAGALCFTFDAPRRFDDAERSFLAAIAEQCGVALDRARALEDERAARVGAERSRAEADRARGLLDALVENAPLGIAFFDREFRYQRVNPMLAEINRLPIAAHLGRTPREILPAALDHVAVAWRRVLETGEPVLDQEFAADTAEGWRVCVGSFYPVRSDGEIVGVGALLRDVTSERAAAEFQRNVLGVVGHDLRNPLSAIVNATGVLLRTDPPPAHARLLQRIGTSAGRIDEIVRSLLDYANVRGGKGVPVRRRRCDLAELARTVAEECAAAHPGAEIRCADDGDCQGEWDPDRVAQVLTNLVSNAVRHATRGTAVGVRCLGRDGEVVVEVENAGPPIAPEIAPRLFEPFRQGDGGGRAGLGLGLFIARAIVQAHGGRIEVRSAGDATTFAAHLPRAWR